MSELSGYDKVDRMLWIALGRNAPDLYLALKAIYDTHSHNDLSDLELQEEAAAGSLDAAACLQARKALAKVRPHDPH